MAGTRNLGLIYKAVPDGVPVPGTHLAVEDHPIDLETQLPENAILVQSLYASLDPYMRQMLVDPESSVIDYAAGFKFNEPLAGLAIAKVLKSNTDSFQPEDIVMGAFQFSQYSVVSLEGNETADSLNKINKINNPFNLNDLSLFLGPLGMTGLTAFSSLYEIGQPKKGETIFISSAAGAVGQIVGVLAKERGLKVIGSVGSDEKLDYITKKLGYDGGFNYKKEKPLAALKRLAPEGLDIYYENVGGEHLEAALESFKNFGRIVSCGMISDYNKPPEKWYGVKNLIQVTEKRLTMRGFIVTDENMGPRYKAQFEQVVGGMISQGRGNFVVDQMGTIETADQAFAGMLEGKNFGKAVVKMTM